MKKLLLLTVLILLCGCSNAVIQTPPKYSLGDSVIINPGYGEPGIIIKNDYHCVSDSYISRIWVYEVLLSNGQKVSVSEDKIEGIFKVSPWKDPYTHSPTLSPPPPPSIVFPQPC
jgi:hypothetical protein